LEEPSTRVCGSEEGLEPSRSDDSKSLAESPRFRIGVRLGETEENETAAAEDSCPRERLRRKEDLFLNVPVYPRSAS